MAHSLSGRHTAFTYKGKAVDLKQVGRELNVRYVLEGSVQRRDSRLRVNVQLIDAETGTHLWADRFDKPVSDLFDMQDEIVSQLANTLKAELIAVEARLAERSIASRRNGLNLSGQSWSVQEADLRQTIDPSARLFRTCVGYRSPKCRGAARYGTWKRLFNGFQTAGR